jgi:hypothetical protein
LQQQLMVAALTCDDVALYNSFVTTYQQELVSSDEALQTFFDGFGGEEGGSAYHSFKTKMANLYSARSAADKKKFCASVRVAFSPALKSEKMSLATFAMSQPSSVNEPYANCGDPVAGGAMVARTPAVSPPAPPSNLLTAQNEAAEAKGSAVASASSLPEDKPLRAGADVNPSPAAEPSTAGSALAAAGANTTAPPASTNAARDPHYQGYGSGYARERERLAEQQRQDQLNGTAPAGSAAGTAGASNAPNSGGRVANSNAYPERSVQGPYGSDAYRERLAQQRAARQRAAQRPGVAVRERYDARGYYWPADPYWQYCYTRYGVRLPCAEAAARYRSDPYYYRAPYDPWRYPSR